MDIAKRQKGIMDAGRRTIILQESNRSDDRAFSILVILYSRKVRAPLDGPPGNSWAQVARAAYVTESGTENRPPPLEEARVKRWGKSPPRSWQHERHGKPRSEQGQICGERCPPRSRHRG